MFEPQTKQPNRLLTPLSAPPAKIIGGGTRRPTTIRGAAVPRGAGHGLRSTTVTAHDTWSIFTKTAAVTETIPPREVHFVNS